jgi:hypothetical protein
MHYATNQYKTSESYYVIRTTYFAPRPTPVISEVSGSRGELQCSVFCALLPLMADA